MGPREAVPRGTSLIDPADAHQLDTLLRRHSVDLQHRLGQNFLIDPRVRDLIAEAAGLDSSDDVLEIGAGAGALTIALAPRCRSVLAVEVDRRMVPVLRDVLTLSAHSNVEIVESDILRLDLAERFPHGGEIVAGNIPYNLTGALMRKLLDRPPRPRRLSLVVQKEVADRWAAATGASLSTVAVQVFAEVEVQFTIPAEAFEPIPKVDSALVRLNVRERPAVQVEDFDRFFRFVEAVFQFRRKQLGNAIGRLIGASSTEAASRLSAIGIDPGRRAQTLSLPDWETLYNAVKLSFGR